MARWVKFVFELHLEFGAVKAALGVGFGDVELAPLFFGGIGHLVWHERGGREDELERFHRLQLAFQCLKGIDGEG